MVRKMSVSPTVTSPLTCGIGILRREATAAIATIRNRKRQLSWWIGKRCREKSIAAAPAATTKNKKGLKKRCLFMALIPDLPTAAAAAGGKAYRSIHETRTPLCGNKLALPGSLD